MACYKLMYSGTIVFVFTAAVFFLLDEFMLGTFKKKTEAQDFVALCVTSASAFETAHKLHTYKKKVTL